jgi:DNA transposition AAA+ family ATPase
LVDQAVTALITTGAMGAIHGPAGLGKTFAVEQTLARAATSGAGVAVVWVEVPSRPTMRLVAATLFSELTGMPAGRRDRFSLTGLLIEALTPDPGTRPGQVGPGGGRVVVVDEAQRLNTECIEYLRYLHDHRATAFTLLLVGGDSAWQVLSREPMLRSRIYRRVPFAPLTEKQVCALIPTFHPIFRGVAAELLLVDDQLAHGNLRDWAVFTRTALELCAIAGRDRLDEEIVRNAFTLHGGGVDAR